MAEIITQTVSPKCYCKYEHIMCEFANDRGYCVKTGCSRRIVINDHPIVNKNLVEVVRCWECRLHGICSTEDVFRFADLSEENRYCGAGKRREDGDT